ncbi:hypothetical protein HGB07_09395 [Candidatus Roizmanbacteria bacterium]|jgi:hypothetical protein|nr:hypothetical protein [Candidatus Roizmanbacteria bacterium]
MADPQTPAVASTGGIIDKILVSLSDVVAAQGKVLGKAIEVQGSLIDSVTKNATSVLTAFTNKVNEALSGMWVGTK